MQYYRGGGIQFAQPAYNPYAGLFGALGAVLGHNAADRQGVKDNLAAVDAEYGNAGTTAASPIRGQGLLGDTSALASQAMGGYTPTAPTATDLGHGLSPAPANPAPIVQPQKDPTWGDARSQLNRGFAQRLKQAAQTMSPEAFQKAMPQFRAQYNQEVADAQSQFNKDQQNRYVDQFEAEQDPRKKIAIGLKSGLIGKEGAMMLVQPGTETKVINTGGDNVVVGYNKFTGRYVNLGDGSEIDAAKLQEMLKPTVTPSAQLSADVAMRGQDISAANTAARVAAAGGGGGMSTGDQRRLSALNTVINQHEQWITKRKDLTGQMPDESQSPYFKAAQQARQLRDQMMFGEAGVQPSTTKVNYTGDPEIDGYIDKARAQGMGEDWINEKVYQSVEAKKQRNAGSTAPLTMDDYNTVLF
jgi:hypothetical protein